MTCQKSSPKADYILLYWFGKAYQTKSMSNLSSGGGLLVNADGEAPSQSAPSVRSSLRPSITERTVQPRRHR
jgi:hypothetical protein